MTKVAVGFAVILLVIGILLGITYQYNENFKNNSNSNNILNNLEFPPTSGKWGPLPLDGPTNDYANLELAVYWWNDTGTYITVKIRVEKPAYIEGLYSIYGWVNTEYLPKQDYDFIKKHGHPLKMINKWYEPGVYTITIPMGTKNLYYMDAFEVDGKWYAVLNVPTISAMDTFRPYRYEITNVKPMNLTVYEKALTATVELGYTAPPYTLVINESHEGWRWMGNYLGYVRQGAKNLEIIRDGGRKVFFWSYFINATSEEGAEEAVQRILDEVIEMYRNGLSVNATDVFMQAWKDAGMPKMRPVDRTVVVVSPGVCYYGAGGHCSVMPRIRYDIMEKVVSGEMPVKVETMFQRMTVIGVGKIGDATVVLARIDTYQIVAVHDETGYHLEKNLVRSETVAILGPIPKSNVNIGPFSWYRIALLVSPAPHYITEPSTFPVVPNLPPPETPLTR